MALGSCSSYGGIPSAGPNPSGAVATFEVLRNVHKGSVVNIPGCPPHPDNAFGSVVDILTTGVPRLDEKGRPEKYYPNIHQQCRYLDDFKKEKFARNLGDDGCKLKLGCLGPKTACNTDKIGWNALLGEKIGVSGCIQCESMCIGCTEPNFAKGKKIFYVSADTAEDNEEF